MPLSVRSIAALAVFMALAAGTLADARPDYCEQGDTHDLPEEAQRVEGQGALERLNGRIEGFGVLGEDLGDMYLIDITDPASFRLRLVAGGGVRPQLWLFAGPGLTSYPEGVGLLANNGAGLDYEGALLLNASTDGTGVVLSEPGFYYVAITGQEPDGDNDDGGGDGRVPQGRSPGVLGDIFEFGPGFEVSGPDGAAGAYPIFRWRGTGDVGPYSVEADGVTLIEDLCPADLDGDGVTGFSDILLVLANWGPCPGPPFACVLEEDFDSFLAGEELIPQQPCFPKCPDDFSWQPWNGNPSAGGALVLEDPDPQQTDNALGISGLDDVVHTFNGLTAGQYLFTADVFIPEGSAFDMIFSLLNAYVPTQQANFSLRLDFDPFNGVVRDIDTGSELPLVIGAWVELSVLIDLDTDTQIVYYDDEVLVVKSWTEGATGGGSLAIAGARLNTILAAGAGAGPIADGLCDDIVFCPLGGPAPCPGDVDGDRLVGFQDLLMILGAWGGCP